MVNHQLIDGIDKVVGKEDFCEGCAYGHSKRRFNPSTGTIPIHQPERINIELCGPLPNPLGGNIYSSLITDGHTHHHWV